MEQPYQCQAGLVRLKAFVALFITRKKRANGGSEVPPARQMLAANQRNQLTGAVEAAAKTAERCADAAHQRDIAVVATAAQKELDKLDKELKRQAETATTSPSQRCARPTPVWGPPARARPRKQRRRGCAFIQTEASASEDEEEGEEDEGASEDELDEHGNLRDLVDDEYE